MQVSIKELNIPLNVGNTGTGFQVKSTKGKHMGRLYISKSGATWFKGREVNGKSVSWEELIEFISENGE